jgi:hypothetical protein
LRLLIHKLACCKYFVLRYL